MKLLESEKKSSLSLVLQRVQEEAARVEGSQYK